jgi:A/G-specific adenine glycosylase
VDDAVREELARRLIRWYAANARDLPWRREGFGAWGVLVSEVMLQQTPVSRVAPRLRRWLTRWPRPSDLAAASPGDAVAAWGNLGYPRRALRLHRSAQIITERHGGVVPREVPELLALPGIGEYTARAVSVFAYGTRHPVVDTNVRRVLARVTDGQEFAGTPAAGRDLAAMSALLPDDDAEATVFDAAMMELGATVCTARKPDCAHCPIADLCRWRATGYPEYSGPRRPRQVYVGSDRQARGALLKLVRLAGVVEAASLAASWPDEQQRERALAGLVTDGLVTRTPEGYSLPGR